MALILVGDKPPIGSGIWKSNQLQSTFPPGTEIRLVENPQRNDFSPGLPVLSTAIVPDGGYVWLEGLRGAGEAVGGFGSYWLAGVVNGQWRTINIQRSSYWRGEG